MKKLSNVVRLYFSVLLLGAMSLTATADVTLTGWGKASCTTNPLPAITYSTGNRLCAQGPAGTSCKGTSQPTGATVFTGAYVTGRISPMPTSSTMSRFTYSCSVSGTTLTCTPDSLLRATYFGAGCTGPSTISENISSVGPVIVSLPADASQLSYGTNSHGICYRTGTPSAVQCRAVTVNYTNGNALPVISWGFGSPVTMFTASELDNDGDTTNDEVDSDDDNDGVPDYIDAEPLNAANANERVLPTDGNYKGSQVRDQSALE